MSDDEWVSAKDIRDWKPPEGWPTPVFDVWGRLAKYVKKQHEQTEYGKIEVLHMNDGKTKKE